jgi:hypothetical protein
VFVFIVVLSEGKAGDFELMGHDLSVELPFLGSALVSVNVILLEQRDTVVGVGGGEVVTAVGDNDFSDSVGVLGLISIRNHEVTGLELLELSSLGVEDSDVTVGSTNEELLTVLSELNARVELVFLLFSRSLLLLSSADGFLTRADIGLREVIVIVLSVDIIPKLEVTFSNSESNQTLSRMAGHGTDVRSDSVHEDNHILFFVSIINCFEDSRSQLHNASVAVSDKEFRAGE